MGYWTRSEIRCPICKSGKIYITWDFSHTDYGMIIGSVDECNVCGLKFSEGHIVMKFDPHCGEFEKSFNNCYALKYDEIFKKWKEANDKAKKEVEHKKPIDVVAELTELRLGSEAIIATKAKELLKSLKNSKCDYCAYNNSEEHKYLCLKCIASTLCEFKFDFGNTDVENFVDEK